MGGQIEGKKYGSRFDKIQEEREPTDEQKEEENIDEYVE